MHKLTAKTSPWKTHLDEMPHKCVDRTSEASGRSTKQRNTNLYPVWHSKLLRSVLMPQTRGGAFSSRSCAFSSFIKLFSNSIGVNIGCHKQLHQHLWVQNRWWTVMLWVYGSRSKVWWAMSFVAFSQNKNFIFIIILIELTLMKSVRSGLASLR